MIRSVRADLPTGVVTFLFTDIEGSTQLIADLGEEEYVDALAAHRVALRQAFSASGGVEVDTQGDAFLYVFASPRDALTAAVHGQEALADGPVRVRMGVHTGEAQVTGEGYAGRELHRAARIAAAGHGGQIVVSAATASLVDETLAGLGQHRLKDFGEPVSLFQLGGGRFPPLKTISNTNLPRPTSSFVGRQRERDELVEMLSNGTRLLTLSGPGGSGKTRLAIEAATELVPEFKAGVFWVGLSTLRDPGLVTETIAHVVGSKNGLTDHIGERELLLVLDNLEQVIDAAPDLGQLLESCENLKFLITSRELLRISGEVDYPVAPLAEAEAIELFCTRAQLEEDGTIAELCRSLDELPLALELAAARTSVLSPAQILERMSERLDLLKGGRDADARQQTLRATIEWSYDLLAEPEQTLLARLAVFRGGCTVEAAEVVADADLDTLQGLVDKSLLRHTDERFWMLETIREFGRERLAASGEEAELRRRHALHTLDFAETLVWAGGDQGEQMGLLKREDDNLRASLDWMRDTGADQELLRLVAALGTYWRRSGLYREEDAWESLALERALTPADARMEVLRSASIRADAVGNHARAETLNGEWLALAEAVGDEAMVLKAMNSAAMTTLEKGDLDAGRAQLMAVRERARAAGDGVVVAFTTVNLSGVANRAGDYSGALEEAGAAMEFFRQQRDDGGVAVALEISGWAALGLQDPARAEGFFQEMLITGGRVGWARGTAAAAIGLGIALIALRREDRGVTLLSAASSVHGELGWSIESQLETEAARQQYDRAVEAARTTLGESGFVAAWAKGAAMAPEDMVAFATTE